MHEPDIYLKNEIKGLVGFSYYLSLATKKWEHFILLFSAVLRLIGVMETSYEEKEQFVLLFSAVLRLLGVMETFYTEKEQFILLFCAVLSLLGVIETFCTEKEQFIHVETLN